LKEKFASDLDGKDDLGFMDDESSSTARDAVNALLSLGYKQSQVNKTMKDIEVAGELSGELEDIIRKALAKMI
jgi:Holliday junction resolvasome RuvABC DNA-binding subunit